MFKLSKNFVLILTLLSLQNILGHDLQAQKQDPSTQIPVLVREEVDNPEFLDSLRFLPVKFTERKGDVLKAYFANRFTEAKIVVPTDFVFTLLPNKRGGFFKISRNGEERISLNEFLKKYKDTYWLLSYCSVNGVNFIYQAHQMVDPRQLAITFGQDRNDNYFNIDSISYWEAMRFSIINIYGLEKTEGLVYWRFIIPTDKHRPVTDDDLQLVELEQVQKNGKKLLVHKRLQYPDGGDDSLILKHGVFELSPYAIVAATNAKIVKGREEISQITLTRKYLEDTFMRQMWAVYYNPDTKIVIRLSTFMGEGDK